MHITHSNKGSKLFTAKLNNNTLNIMGGFLNASDSENYPIEFIPNCVSSLSVHQVHHNDILVLNTPKAVDKTLKFKKTQLEFDGIITNQSQLAITIKTADCIPILAYHQSEQMIAALHCGWRPLAAGIIDNFFKKIATDNILNNKTKNQDWVFIIGPGICKTCYEVGEEPINQFTKVISKDILFTKKIVSPLNEQENIIQGPKNKEKKFLLDLKKMCSYLISKHEVPNKNIIIDETCNYTHSDFNSYRENKTKARNISFIVLH